MKDLIAFIFSRLKPYRKTVVFCSALALAAAAFDTVAPIIMGRGFDLAKGHAAFFWIAAAITIWAALGYVSQLIRNYIGTRGEIISAHVGESYLRASIAELVRKPLSFHYGKKGQDVSERIGQFRWDMEGLIQNAVFELIPGLITVAAILAYLAIVEWRIAAALAVFIALLVWYARKVAPSRIERNQAWNKVNRAMHAFGWDALRNVLVVKATTNEARVDRVLEGHGEKFLKTIADNNAFNFGVWNRESLIIRIGSFSAVLLAVWDFSRGAFTLGQLTAVTAYAFSIFGYIQGLQWQFRSLLKTTASYRAVRELLDEPAEDYASGRRIALQGGVEFRHIAFRYRDDRPILEDVSFKVAPGQRIAVVGESGEGKTTIVDLLGRYFEPRTGEILFDGIDSRGVNRVALREQMAYVPQDLTLFHESLDYNIRYGRPDATDEEVREAIHQAHLEEFIAGLPEKEKTVVGERGLKISGGERQRVALARAFLRDPKILVLDEPTSNLDSKTEGFIQDALEKLMKGRTTFIIAHRLKTVAGADLTLVLKNGRIVEAGTHRELIRDEHGVYRALLKAQGGFIAPNERDLGQEIVA